MNLKAKLSRRTVGVGILIALISAFGLAINWEGVKTFAQNLNSDVSNEKDEKSKVRFEPTEQVMPPPTNDTFAGAITINANQAVAGNFGTGADSATNNYQLAAPGAPTCFSGATQTASTAPGRDLVYSFTAPATGLYSFRVQNTGGTVVSGGNLVIYLVDGTPTGMEPISIPCQATGGTPPVAVAASNRNANTTVAAEEILGYSMTMGQSLFIVIDEGTAGTSAIPFNLEVFATTLETEPNNTFATAQAYSCGIEGSSVNTGSGAGQDFDYYTIGTPADGSRIFAIADAGAASSTDIDMRINNATSTFEYDDANNDSEMGGSAPNIVGLPLTAANGPFAIQVDYFGSSTVATTEPYRLYSVIQPPIGSATLETGSENGTIATAQSATNNYFSGTLSSGTDVDVYATGAIAGDLLFVGLDNNPNRNLSSAANGNFEILDGSGNVIFTFGDSGTAATSPFTPVATQTSTTPISGGEAGVYRVPATGIYYIRVLQTGTVVNAPYLLSISKNCQTGGGGTILPGPGTFQFSAATYTGVETQTATITVNRTGGNTGTVTVNYATSNGTATGSMSCPGADYATTSGTLTFNEGETSKTFTVQICGDTAPEAVETVNLTLSMPTGGATIGTPNPATLNIVDTASQYMDMTPNTVPGTGTGNSSEPGAPALLYPATITVSGAPTSITQMRVTLYNVSHTFPDDMDILLVGPTGQTFVLMADAGGSTALNGTTITFSDAGAAVVPDAGPIVSTTYEPANYGAVTNFPAPAPVGPYNEPGATFAPLGGNTFNTVFGGTNANGVWNLFVRDDAAGDAGVIGGWGLEFAPPLASNAAIGGRITTAGGNGIRGAVVSVSGGNLPQPIFVRTGNFGYYQIEDLEVGQTYVVTVHSKRFTFSNPSVVLTLQDNIGNLDFQASP
jgi:hypothetical protein